ncbi:MAG: type IX secretion system membrane protein PorP/SprF, partial [Bacteroidota bacterium]
MWRWQRYQPRRIRISPQFFASPLTLNPALTGKFDGVYRVAGNYRNQWPSISNAYTTATVSYDMGIMKNRIPEYDQ